jgi:hypothetical protein
MRANKSPAGCEAEFGGGIVVLMPQEPDLTHAKRRHRGLVSGGRFPLLNNLFRSRDITCPAQQVLPGICDVIAAKGAPIELLACLGLGHQLQLLGCETPVVTGPDALERRPATPGLRGVAEGARR